MADCGPARSPAGDYMSAPPHPPDLPLFGAELLDGKGGAVIVTEGEKAAIALRTLGALSLGTVTGASNTPSPEVLADLGGRDVILWPAHDAPGREHMRMISEALQGIARSVRVIAWGTEEGDDAADFVARGGTMEELARLRAAPPSATREGGTAPGLSPAPARMGRPRSSPSSAPLPGHEGLKTETA